MICDSHTFLKPYSYANLQTENLSIQSVVKYFTLMKI